MRTTEEVIGCPYRVGAYCEYQVTGSKSPCLASDCPLEKDLPVIEDVDSAIRALGDVRVDGEVYSKPKLTAFHSDECKANMLARQQLRDEWRAKWPHHCVKCEGAGGFEYPGSEDDPPDIRDGVCDCVLENLCPRCGHRSIVWLVTGTAWMLYDTYSEEWGDTPFCASCGWLDRWQEGTPPCPAEPECRCWYENEKEISKQEQQQHDSDLRWANRDHCAHRIGIALSGNVACDHTQNDSGICKREKCPFDKIPF